MQSTATALPILSHRSIDQSGGGQPAVEAKPLANLFESAELLKGGKAVGILHNGALYRLQSTKLGKLILTK